MNEISDLSAKAYAGVKALENALDGAKNITDVTQLAIWHKDKILSAMSELRAAADALEGIVSAEYWPIPTYGDLLFEI